MSSAPITIPAPDAQSLFDDWERDRKSVSRDPISDRSAKNYRYIWRVWTKYLASEPFGDGVGVPWDQVTLEHLEAFLSKAVSPSSSRHSPSTPISPVTRQRYRRLLDRIYQHALNKHYISVNPMKTMNEAGFLSQQDLDGQVFNPVQWDLIKAAFPQGDGRWALRDRAMLSLLMDMALTTSEVCDLRMEAVSIITSPPVLRLSGARTKQTRELYVRQQTWNALCEWLQERQTMRPRSHDCSDWLFVSKKGYPMSPRALFHLVAKTIRKAFLSAGMDMPNHIGPSVLRNTRIVMWLNDGIELDKVLEWAGYKDFRSLRNLRSHVHDNIILSGD
jgi:site-specific recombinase XerD